MRILTRYILKEVSSHALLGVLLFTFIIFMRDLGRLLELVVRNSAPLPSVGEIFLYTLPTAFMITLPMGVLVGILIGLSRLAADSEVTAIRASGMGAGMFVRVVAMFAIAAWLLAMLNSIAIAPRSARALTGLQNKLRSSQASFEIQPRVFYEEFKDRVLYVQDAIPSKGQSLWRGVFLADISDPASPRITLAERGALLSESPEKVRFHLEDGTQQELIPKAKDQYSITTFETTDLPVQVPSSTERGFRDLQPVAELSLHALLRNAAREEAAGASLVKIDPASSSYDYLKARYYEIEFHRRFALPGACLVLALVGIPLGLSAHKGGRSAGFVLTIVLVFVYYFFSLVGVSLARQGKVSPWFGVWAGNLFFFVCGLILVWRVDRMPLDFSLIHRVTVVLRNTLRAWGKRLPGLRESRWTRAMRRKPRKLYGARFPLILDNMILRDFALYLAMVLVTFLILALVFTFFELLTDIVRNKVSFVLLAAYLLNLSPSLVYLMAPMSVMLAVLITFGLLQKSSELTAMKATGFSIYRATLPVIVLSAAFAAGLFVFDQVYIPHTNRRQEILRNEIKGKPPQTYLQADRKWIFGESKQIYYYQVFDPDTNQFGGISVFEFDPATFQLTRRVHADGAHWEPGLQEWVFQNGWVRTLNGTSIQEYRTFDVATFKELHEDPSYFKKEVRQSSQMDYEELKRYISDLQQSGFDTVRLKVQLQKKLAYPLITLVMAILAIPFSAQSRRGGALAGVAIALGVAIVYWVTAGLFEAMGNANQLPALIAAWAPDLIFGLAGGYLLLRVPT
ncbi:MAG TPA: LPS export ABC transporter permease LptF [Candidatus Binatia bacterium]|nr:LPS export ABC transporter permease LptF [Candidatus Binatia bacterium]